MTWSVVSSDHATLCLKMLVPVVLIYDAGLLGIFSGVASFWPICHLAQMCKKFHWLLSFQGDVPLHKAAVCTSARAVHEAVLSPRFIFGSSLEVFQCGHNSSFSKMLGSPMFFSFGNNGVLCHPSFLPKLYIKFPGGLGQTLAHGSLVNSHLQWISFWSFYIT